nr:hypothetical protein [Tanacetum cinerariifolium]
MNQKLVIPFKANLETIYSNTEIQIYRLENVKVWSSVCVLEKCLRLLGSESGTFTLPEKSMISMYISNTMRYLLQTQVEAGLLSSLILLTLTEKLENIDGDSPEWRPLKSFRLGEFTSLAHNPEKTTAFSSSMLSASPDLILQHFPAVISISKNLCGVPFSILLSICFLERGSLNDVCKSWPELSFLGLERVVASVHDQSNGDFSSMDSTNFEAFLYFLNKVPFYVLFPAIELLESAYWMFSRIDLSSVHKSSKFSALSAALNIAGCAFEFMQEVDVTLFEKACLFDLNFLLEY